MALRVVLAGMLLMAGSAAAAPSPPSEKEALGMFGLQPEEPDQVTVPETLAKVQEPSCRLMQDAQGSAGPAGESMDDVTQRVCTPLLSQPGMIRPPVDPEDPEATLWWVHHTVQAGQAEAEALAAQGQEQAGSLAEQAQGLPDEVQEEAERLPAQAEGRAGELRDIANATADHVQAEAGAVQDEAERTAEDPQGGVERASETVKGMAGDAVRFVKDLWPF